MRWEGGSAARREAVGACVRVVSAALFLVLAVGGCSTSQPEVTSTQVEEAGAPASPSAAPAARAKKPKRVDAKSLEGGGFASTAPGSDAPDRKDDTGPVIPLSSQAPDIEEIERLVREVERIANQQGTGDPLETGGSLAAAVGSFGYRYFADGSVQPEASWVSANITSETVPILGEVNCHRVMLLQLRSALQEVVDRGLADKINPEEYAGCYVPRFIGRDPANGLSLHSWGIAVDLNVPGNLRGSVGEIDRTVVAIFKKWGFAWGGDWDYTDPMHFELARLVRAE